MPDSNHKKRQKRFRKTKSQLIDELGALEAIHSIRQDPKPDSKECLPRTRDVLNSDDKERIRQLSEANERYRNLIEQAPIGIVEVGPDGTGTARWRRRGAHRGIVWYVHGDVVNRNRAK